MILFIYLLGATLLYFALNYLELLVTLLVGKGNSKSIRYKFWPLFEGVVWLLFFLAIALNANSRALFSSRMSVAATAALLLLFGWYFLRDYIAGLIIKVESGFEPGLQIKVNSFQGSIAKVGYRSITLLLPQSEQITIPYSTIGSYSITSVNQALERQEHHIELHFHSHLEPSQLSRMVKKRVLELPWITGEQDFKVELSSPAKGSYLLEVTLYTTSTDIALKSKSAIATYIDEEFPQQPL
ncbi:MAG: mechanosensitive ion channel domain-containing protein [Bacteroidales bacterium]